MKAVAGIASPPLSIDNLKSILFIIAVHHRYASAGLLSDYNVENIQLLHIETEQFAKGLAPVLQSPDSFSGIVLTSVHAVAGAAAAATAATQTKAVPATWPGWEGDIFVVGQATAAAASLTFPNMTMRGAETGSATALATYIVDEQNHKDKIDAHKSTRQQPLLFLKGNQARPELEAILNAGGVPIVSEVVYQTVVPHGVGETVRSRVSRGDVRWLVFFSPSGVNAVLPTLGSISSTIRLAAIGPTTASAIRSHNASVTAMAVSPTPDALIAAVVAADTNCVP